MGIQMVKIFCFLLFGIILTPDLSNSFPYQPEEIILLNSQPVSGLEESLNKDGFTWRLEPEVSQADGSVSLVFFKEMSDIQICKLVLSSANTIDSVDIPGVNSNLMIFENDLLIVPGFPVPCDILPVQRMTGDHSPVSQVYNVRRSAGTQTFIDALEVQIYPVAYEAALANGWIKSALNADTNQVLQVIQVVNQKSGEIKALQVWRPGDDWWIYEKTPFRQSWRLP